jgi:hypothetical protein
MLKRKHDDRNFVERNNDTILLWEYIGAPLLFFICAAVIIGLIIGGFTIKNKIEKYNADKASAKAYETRLAITEEFIEKNSKTFGEIKEMWNEDNLFFVKNDQGTFTIRFVENEIYEVVFTSNGGTTKRVYINED